MLAGPVCKKCADDCCQKIQQGQSQPQLSSAAKKYNRGRVSRSFPATLKAMERINSKAEMDRDTNNIWIGKRIPPFL